MGHVDRNGKRCTDNIPECGKSSGRPVLLDLRHKGAMRQGAQLDELSDRLRESIRDSVRHSDALCRYGKGQYLVLLINTTSEDCKIVQRRINEHFIIRRQRTGIRYHVNIVVSRY